jgi:hypothetical protein
MQVSGSGERHVRQAGEGIVSILRGARTSAALIAMQLYFGHGGQS